MENHAQRAASDPLNPFANTGTNECVLDLRSGGPPVISWDESGGEVHNAGFFQSTFAEGQLSKALTEHPRTEH